MMFTSARHVSGQVAARDLLDLRGRWVVPSPAVVDVAVRGGGRAPASSCISAALDSPTKLLSTPPGSTLPSAREIETVKPQLIARRLLGGVTKKLRRTRHPPAEGVTVMDDSGQRISWLQRYNMHQSDYADILTSRIKECTPPWMSFICSGPRSMSAINAVGTGLPAAADTSGIP